LIDAEFEAFAATEQARKGPPCTVCRLPADLLDLITRKVAEGHRYSVVGAFVRSKAHKMADGTIGKHFREKHVAR
jgi:hypothetical protein